MTAVYLCRLERTRRKKIFAAAPNTEVNPGVIVREDSQQSGSLFELAVFLLLLFLLAFLSLLLLCPGESRIWIGVFCDRALNDCCQVHCFLWNIVFGFKYFATKLVIIVVILWEILSSDSNVL